MLFLLLIFNPVAEEFLFRKLVLDRLLRFGAITAILVSSILFALPHAFSQGIPAVPYTFILGMVWAYMRVRTQTLWVPIALHSFSNFWGMIAPSLLMTGTIGPILYFTVWILIVPIAAILLLHRNRNRIRATLRKTA